MTTSSLPTTRSRSETYHFVTRALVIAQGAITLVACFLVFPLGAALVVTNGVLAIITRGTNRRLFAGFAIAGAAICIAIALFLTGVAFSGDVGPVTEL